MMAFRSRKRKAGAPRETQAKTPPADAAATTPTGSPTKHPVAAFANTVYVDPVIKSVYRYVDKKTFLNWGLTSDWLVEGPRKRRASGVAATTCTLSPPTPQKPERGGSTAERLAGSPESDEDEDPNASSEGYGEMTEGSIERLLVFLRTLGSHPEVERLAARKTALSPKKKKNGAENKSRLGTKNGTKNVRRGVSARNDHLSDIDLTSSSSFIDVGSGYGKVVLHARLSARVAEAAGIEYVAARADMAGDALRELRSGKHAFVTPEALALLRDAHATRLTKGDATKLGAFQFSHVYMYDKVFSDPTTALLAAQLNASEKTKVLVSYQRAEQWRRLGLDARFVEVASLTMRTTGGQNFKAYVFVRAG